jgi:hypothetical protein
VPPQGVAVEGLVFHREEVEGLVFHRGEVEEQ